MGRRAWLVSLSRQIGVEFRTHTSDQMYVTAILRGCASAMRTEPLGGVWRLGAMTSSVIQFALDRRDREDLFCSEKSIEEIRIFVNFDDRCGSLMATKFYRKIFLYFL